MSRKHIIRQKTRRRANNKVFANYHGELRGCAVKYADPSTKYLVPENTYSGLLSSFRSEIKQIRQDLLIGAEIPLFMYSTRTRSDEFIDFLSFIKQIILNSGQREPFCIVGIFLNFWFTDWERPGTNTSFFYPEINLDEYAGSVICSEGAYRICRSDWSSIRIVSTIGESDV